MKKNKKSSLSCASKINKDCCKHETRKGYLIGYIGFKSCKVAMCCDCDSRQFIGNWFGKFLFPLARRIFHNRMSVVARLYVDEEQNEN